MNETNGTFSMCNIFFAVIKSYNIFNFCFSYNSFYVPYVLCKHFKFLNYDYNEEDILFVIKFFCHCLVKRSISIFNYNTGISSLKGCMGQMYNTKEMLQINYLVINEWCL